MPEVIHYDATSEQAEEAYRKVEANNFRLPIDFFYKKMGVRPVEDANSFDCNPEYEKVLNLQRAMNNYLDASKKRGLIKQSEGGKIQVNSPYYKNNVMEKVYSSVERNEKRAENFYNLALGSIALRGYLDSLKLKNPNLEDTENNKKIDEIAESPEAFKNHIIGEVNKKKRAKLRRFLKKFIKENKPKDISGSFEQE